MYGRDTETQIFFYEADYYIFSNFSSFTLKWKGKLYPTSEQAYQAEKFEDEEIKEAIRTAPSAHEAYFIAQEKKSLCNPSWDNIKLGIMKDILRTKVQQHPYVKKKLLASGDKELVEDSWRDDFWGWGPNKNGANHLGKLWMEVREEYKK